MLKLNGKPFDPHAPGPVVRAVIAWLDKSPVDEIFTVDVIAKNVGASPHTVQQYGRSPHLAAYRCGQRGSGIVWGNPKAIAEYKKLTGAK